jgi:hypothetical protein
MAADLVKTGESIGWRVKAGPNRTIKTFQSDNGVA